jgi:spermidine/putrescine transport system ATP-binding protein
VNEGRIEQIGAVSDVYHRPRTAFVASFLGETNLLPAKVIARSGGRVRLGVSDHVALLANDAEGDLGAEVTVAVRPEKIHVEKDDFEIDGTFVATVEDEIFRGPLVQLFLRTDDGLALEAVMATRTADRDVPAKGDRVRWWVHRDDVVVLGG